MIKKIFANKFWVIAALSLILIMPSLDAFAYDRGHHHGWTRLLPPRHEVVVVRGSRYHYYDGRFYRPGFFGFGFSIAIPPLGAIVTSLPFGYRTIVVTGTPYYCYDDVYYRPYSGGYIVVPAPAAAPVVVQPQGNETVTINVPNSRGGYTPVTLIKQGNGYIGPQGEYYSGNPSIDQLRALYGR